MLLLGLATGLVTTSQQVGIALGTSVMSAIATGVFAATPLSGLHLVIGVNAAIAIGAANALAIFLRLPNTPAQEDAESATELT